MRRIGLLLELTSSLKRLPFSAIALALSLGAVPDAMADSVVGNGAAGRISFIVNASAGRNGENATGFVVLAPDLGVAAAVQSLVVNGNTASISGPLTSGPPVGDCDWVVDVQDNAATGVADVVRVRVVPRGATPSCPAVDETVTVTDGDIAVVDDQGDAVVGGGETAGMSFTISATSGPAGETPAGTVAFFVGGERREGTVTALCVSGHRAVVAGVVTGSAPPGFTLFVQDNAPEADGVLLEMLPEAPASCPPFPESALDPVLGDVAVADETVPPAAGLPAVKDTFLHWLAPNANEGANLLLRVQGILPTRTVVGFDLTAVVVAAVTRARLVLTVADSRYWGIGPIDDGTIDAHPLLADFAEGNSENASLPWGGIVRGSGQGATWRCAVDTDIANFRRDCDTRWNGGTFGPATAPGVRHADGLTGEVIWDVTADVQAGVSAWLVRKTREFETGTVDYYSREAAVAAGFPELAPRLILE
jgi:hypothetical protein